MRRKLTITSSLLLLAVAAANLAEAQVPATGTHPTSIVVTIKGMKQGMFKDDVGVRGIRAIRFLEQTQKSSTGNRQYNPITFTKEWGPSSPQIADSLATNEVLDTVIFEFERVALDGRMVTYQRITLKQATISSVRRYIGIASGAEPPDNRALEDVSVAFTNITIEDLMGKTMMADNLLR